MQTNTILSILLIQYFHEWNTARQHFTSSLNTFLKKSGGAQETGLCAKNFDLINAIMLHFNPRWRLPYSNTDNLLWHKYIEHRSINNFNAFLPLSNKAASRFDFYLLVLIFLTSRLLLFRIWLTNCCQLFWHRWWGAWKTVMMTSGQYPPRPCCPWLNKLLL